MKLGTSVRCIIVDVVTSDDEFNSLPLLFMFPSSQLSLVLEYFGVIDDLSNVIIMQCCQKGLFCMTFLPCKYFNVS